MSRARRRHWLSRDERGASAVEFALVAPLLFAVLLVAIEIIVILFADAVLEGTANRVTRIGKIGVPEGQRCEQVVRAEVERSLAHWAHRGEVHVDTIIYEPGEDPRFADVDDEGYEPICDTGGRGEIVMYRVGFDRAGLTGVLSWMDIEIMRLERTVAIQNEP